MLIDRITNARLTGHHALVDLTLAAGRVVSIEPSPLAELPARGVPSLDSPSLDSPALDSTAFDAGGRVVTAGFVDAHVHLDKAFLPIDGCAPRLADAIVAVDRQRAGVGLDDVIDNTRQALDLLVRHGTVAARVHAEISPQVGLDLVAAQLALAETEAGRIALQLVAFPQLGLEIPGAASLLGSAMALGTPVVGGCPYVDADPRAHLDVVFGLADTHQAPVDLHLDFSDDPSRSQLGLVAERTRALGLAGRVTVGHVTTLAAMAPADQCRALAEMAEAGIGLVVAPATDLYLGGHGEPGTRSLAPIERAVEAGVRVAIATNNLANPFAPYGNGSLLHAAWLAGLTRRLQPTDALVAMISTTPAALLGLDLHGPVVGAAAHLVVLDTLAADTVVERCPSVVATVRDGALTCADARLATGAVK